MREPRDLSARIVLVDDVALRGLHEFRFRTRHRLQRRIAVAALDRLFDNANRAAHLGTAGLVDNGAAGNLARRLLGGSRIGHVLKYPSAVTVAAGRAWTRRLFSRVIDAGVFPGIPEDTISGAKRLT